MFLATLTEGCDKTGLPIHSYCLIANHLHLAIETPNANLVALDEESALTPIPLDAGRP